MTTTQPPAPIALFAFKRPAHLQRSLESLARNPEFERSELHIYCDGARRSDELQAVEQTRAIARAWPHPAKRVHEAETNRGLARSIMAGVGSLCAEHGRVIVVEDDLVVAPSFLDFLNRGLSRYEDERQVMQVSGHMFAVGIPADVGDAVCLPFPTSWGWATWHRAWQHFDPDMQGYEALATNRSMRRRFDLNGSYPYFSMLNKQRAGTIDSWAIRWRLSIFMQEGLVVYPRESLVSNEGFDGSGTHCGPADAADGNTGALPSRRLTDLRSAAIDERVVAAVFEHLKSRNNLLARGGRYLRRALQA